MSDCTVASLRTPSRLARRSRSACSWPSRAESVATQCVYHGESRDGTNRGSLFARHKRGVRAMADQPTPGQVARNCQKPGVPLPSSKGMGRRRAVTKLAT